MAGFEVIIYGRFWVITEDGTQSWVNFEQSVLVPEGLF